MKQFVHFQSGLDRIYTEIFSDDKGTLLEWDRDCSYGDPSGIVRGWVSKEGMEYYKEFKEPVVEVLYGMFGRCGLTTLWHNKQGQLDELKLTIIDGKLSNVELIK